MVTHFRTVIEECHQMLNKSFQLKEEQILALEKVCLYHDLQQDVIMNVPVGFGKSIVYQLMPSVLKRAHKRERLTILVISPLNIVQEQQLKDLFGTVRSCRLDFNTGEVQDLQAQVQSLNLDLDVAEAEEEDDLDEHLFDDRLANLTGDLADVKRGGYDIVFCHPEALLQTEKGLQLLGDDDFKERVAAVVIDECHLIDTWGKNFRKSYSALATMSSHFPEVPFVCLSGTLTKQLKHDLPKILGLRNPFIIEKSPDRTNIFLRRIQKVHCQDSIAKYEAIYKPEAERLHQDPETYPITIMFLPMISGNALANAAEYLNMLFKGETITTARYSVIYSSQDKDVISKTIEDQSSDNPRIRLILSTSAGGMGFNPINVTRVIHAKPPKSMIDYLQQIGRCGRQGQPSEAILYHDNRDVAKNVKDMDPAMVEYCKTQNCLRQTLLAAFDFKKEEPVSPCCSNCERN